MFQLTAVAVATLIKINMRTEKHGKQDVDAYDLFFGLTDENKKILGLLHPALCESVYCNVEADEGQIELIEGEGTLPNRKFPKLGDLIWSDEADGYDLCFLYGLGDDESNIRLDDGKVVISRVECTEGGSATLFFRFSTASMPDGSLDKLRKLLKQQVSITLVRPEKLRQDAVIDGSVGAFRADHPDSVDPTDLFLDQHGEGAADDEDADEEVET